MIRLCVRRDVVGTAVASMIAGVSMFRATTGAFAGVREDVSEHIAALDHEDYQVRWEALGELSKLGPDAEPAVPTLIRLLKSDLDRFRVIHVLGEIGPGAAPAVPALIDYLERSLAVHEKQFKDESTDAIGIIQTMAKIGPVADAAGPVLREALKDEVSSIRYVAAHALGQMGPRAREAIPDLEARLSDHEYVGLYMFPHGKDIAEVALRALERLRSFDGSSEPSESQ